MLRTACIPLALTLMAVAPAAETAFTIDREASVLAIATQRAGIAGRMAHDHLIHAGGFDYALAVSGADPESVTFSLTLAAEGLVVDEPDALARWWPRLQEHGLVDRGPSSLSEGERADVRASMLGADQLNAEEHPAIRAEIVSIAGAESADNTTHRITVAVTVAGATVEYPFDAVLTVDDGRLEVEAHTVARFTDFGIRPYRAFLGAVRNQDEFVVFVHVVATANGHAGD